jgi:hypothetical protein
MRPRMAKLPTTPAAMRPGLGVGWMGVSLEVSETDAVLETPWVEVFVTDGEMYPEIVMVAMSVEDDSEEELIVFNAYGVVDIVSFVVVDTNSVAVDVDDVVVDAESVTIVLDVEVVSDVAITVAVACTVAETVSLFASAAFDTAARSKSVLACKYSNSSVFTTIIVHDLDAPGRRNLPIEESECLRVRSPDIHREH